MYGLIFCNKYFNLTLTETESSWLQPPPPPSPFMSHRSSLVIVQCCMQKAANLRDISILQQYKDDSYVLSLALS